MSNRYMYILIVGLLFFSGCQEKIPDNILPPEKMKMVMWDVMNADEWNGQMIVRDVSLANKKANVHLYEEVFKIHGISREKFYNSYRYYEQHPLVFKVVLDSMYAMGEREKIKSYADGK